MKRLTREKQAKIIPAPIEGDPIRAISRILGVSKDTVLESQVEAGPRARDRRYRMALTAYSVPLRQTTTVGRPQVGQLIVSG